MRKDTRFVLMWICFGIFIAIKVAGLLSIIPPNRLDNFIVGMANMCLFLAIVMVIQIGAEKIIARFHHERSCN